MKAQYLRTPRITAKTPSKEQILEEMHKITLRESESDLVKIYHSLKKNFRAKNFSLFSDDAGDSPPKKKSLSKKKLSKLKLPKLPRILHGDSKQSKNSKKLHLKEEIVNRLGSQTTRQSSYLNKVFRPNARKRTNSDLVPSNSKILSVAQFSEKVARATAMSIKRKQISKPVNIQRVHQLTNAIRPIKLLSWKQINFEFEPLEEREFMNMMRSYNYIRVGQNVQGYYRAYIIPGNNSEVVKKCLKARGHWVMLEAYDQTANFVWSQLRRRNYDQKFEPREIQLTESNDTIIPPSSPTKKPSPLQQFFINRLNEFPFLHSVQASMEESVFLQYLGRVLSMGYRNITRAPDFYKLTQNLERKRPKITPHEIPNPHNTRLHNHVQNASTIGNKKGLFRFMKLYYEYIGKNPFEVIPQTVHVSSGTRLTEENLMKMLPFDVPCIVKPGQNTNRGNGVTVHTQRQSLLRAVSDALKSQHTAIVQKYVTPFLYKSRKFDIRVWVLWSGRIAWWYRQGYIRTSSKQFNIKNPCRFVHLTNDAVQKYGEDYGRYQQGNKLSFNQFQRYLEHTGSKHNFWQGAYPQMKRIARDVFRVGNMTINTKNKMFGYELFGLDFMIDESFKVWLIEVNTNPCLQTSCNLLTRLINNMIDNVVSIAVDPLFPPPEGRKRSHFNFQSGFKFQFLFDGYTDPMGNIFPQVKCDSDDTESQEEENES